MKRFYLLAALLLATGAFAQTAGTVTFGVTPANGASPVTPSASWSTSPAATSCAISGAATVTGLAGSGTRALPAITADSDYTLTCAWPGGTGSWTIGWAQPMTYTDGSLIAAEPAGKNKPVTYKVVYGTSAAALTQTKAVADATATSATLTGLTNGTWFAAVRATTPSPVDSDNSAVISKSIVVAPVTASKAASVAVSKVPSPPTNPVTIETTARNVTVNYDYFLFLSGSAIANVPLGVDCDPKRRTDDGFNVIADMRKVTPRQPAGKVLVAKCAAT